MRTTARQQNDVVIFDLEGEFKRSNIPDLTLHQLVKEQLDRGKRKIVLNMEAVDFIDSYGVGELVASHISTHNLGGKLKLVKISKRLYIIFQVTMLINIFNIYDDEETALNNFS